MSFALAFDLFSTRFLTRRALLSEGESSVVAICYRVCPENTLPLAFQFMGARLRVLQRVKLSHALASVGNEIFVPTTLGSAADVISAVLGRNSIFALAPPSLIDQTSTPS